MQALLSFIFIFGVIVVIHEFGHFYFAKKAGILVREFAVGMGPKVFGHQAKDGTVYTIRLLPLGGYVRMAGWGEDKTSIRTGSPASLSLNAAGQVTRINLSEKQLDPQALPINVLTYDLEDTLEITGQTLEGSRSFPVHHEATIVEADGTELRIAPLDVQYQNASVWGRLMTNFAGPMNNFILGAFLFVLLAFLQGGVPDYSNNQVRVSEGGALAQAGLSGQIEVLSINGREVTDWDSLSRAVALASEVMETRDTMDLRVRAGGQERQLDLKPLEQDGRYFIGVAPGLKTGFVDKVVGGLQNAWDNLFLIATALKNLILKPDVRQLGGPIAIYQMSQSAARDGFLSVLGLMAMLSLNLGLFNLLPIPALDGGKILFNLVELVRRKPLKQQTEQYITIAGVAIMLLLTIAVTWNDIVRTFF